MLFVCVTTILDDDGCGSFLVAVINVLDSDWNIGIRNSQSDDTSLVTGLICQLETLEYVKQSQQSSALQVYKHTMGRMNGCFVNNNNKTRNPPSVGNSRKQAA